MGARQSNRILREHFAHVVRTLGQELLEEDMVVAEAFLDTDQHVTEQEVLDRVSARDLDLGHVRRTLRLLCELGIAERTTLDGSTYYEHLHLDNHHDHLICVRCGRIIEFADAAIEAGQQRLCASHQFVPLMHKLEIRGVCRECAEAMPETRTLAGCMRGERVEVVGVLGGMGVKRRLMEMGLTRGTVVTILSADGPVGLEVRGGRLALGRQEAARVIVRLPAKAEPAHGESDDGNP